MTLPASTYDVATATVPAGNVTDFSLLVDLSRMSAAWWSAVDTTEGRKGRAAKDDGTELAVDFIAFDSVNETGIARVLWSGTIGTKTSVSLRIYPPMAANSTVIRSSTYGAYNAYNADWGGYWPLQDDATDRCAPRNDLTVSVGMGIGDATGKFGSATNFNEASTEYLEAPDDAAFDTNDDAITLMAWGKSSNRGTWQGLLGRQGSSTGHYAMLAQRGTSDDMSIRNLPAGGATVEARGGIFDDGVWQHWAGTVDEGDGEVELFNNAVSIATRTGTVTLGDQSGEVRIGNSMISPSNYWDGDIQDCQYHCTHRDDNWIGYEYDQSNDQASFWGTWTNVPVVSNRRRAMIVT